MLHLDAIVVIQANGNAIKKLSAYLAQGYTGSVHCTVVGVEEDFETAEALRSIKDKIDVGCFVIWKDIGI
jgi:translation initiation factor eIF-2B subunit gamma